MAALRTSRSSDQTPPAADEAVDYRAFPILVVDDEPEILKTFEFNYRREFAIVTAESTDTALAVLRDTDVALIVADQRMPGRSGVDLLTEARALRPDALRIILTGYTDMETLVRGVNEGEIYRYVAKPWESAELRGILQTAIETFVRVRAGRTAAERLRRENERLYDENRYLRERDAGAAIAHGIIGASAAMRRVFELIARVRDAPTPVLLQGETGTGKELVARAIHFGGAYAARLFVAQNCGALAGELLESELFGHRRGSFTGATADKKGLFELADGGTLFLDEISETTSAFQVKLLRVLQDGEIRPVGEGRPRRVQVRVIAASNRDLAAETAAGRFRADLYYRLNVFPITLPPLRARREDIPELARHFVAKHAALLGRKVGDLTSGAVTLLAAYDYPGNVRELENEMERAVLLCNEGDEVAEELLSERIVAAGVRGASADGTGPRSLATLVAEFERARILEMLEACGGNKSEAARRFGLTYRGLLAKMQRLGCA
jgi:two-component system, NtrC family, response regulator HupR/HoxA